MKGTSRHRRIVPAMISVLAVALAACSGGGELEVTQAWARTSPSMAEAGAAYMQIANGTDNSDALVGVSVDPAVAGAAEIHETVAAEPDMGDGGHTATSDTGAPMMEMHAIDRLEIPAGETVTLEPGGYHVMLLDLVSPLEAGSTIELALTFENAGEVVVEAEVRDSAP
jgi:copper(I)-binding protein